MVKILGFNENFFKIECDSGIAMEINDHFTFYCPGYKFMPKYKSGLWDGKIRMFDVRNRLFPVGLLFDLIRFLRRMEYEISVDRSAMPVNHDQLIEDFQDSVVPSLTKVPRDFQESSFERCIKNNRALVLSATASGKSLIIYLLVRFFLDNFDRKILISVPSLGLVRQMKEDFCSYETSPRVCEETYQIYSGQKKETEKRVIIATLAMLRTQPASFYSDFSTYICDESHQADTQSVAYIMGKIPHVKYRFGFTGTLDGTKIHELQCKAWFGKVIEASKTIDLIEKGILSNMNISAISLQYPHHEKKIVRGLDYQNEIKYIVSHPKRNQFIVDTALNQKNNTLVLFNYVEGHGEVLLKMAREQCEKENLDKEVFFIAGSGKEKAGVEVREEIRQKMETQNNVVLFASFGTFSVGVNVKNLHCLILAHPFKARIRILQSIGRVLRKCAGKNESLIVDIIDDFSTKAHHNTVFNHGKCRLGMYDSERFNVNFTTENVSDL